MAYKIEFSSSAMKQFNKLPKEVQRKIVNVIDPLSEEPRPSGVVKLSGETILYRIRVGNYRVIYHIKDDRLEVLILKIGHRRDIYK